MQVLNLPVGDGLKFSRGQARKGRAYVEGIAHQAHAGLDEICGVHGMTIFRNGLGARLYQTGLNGRVLLNGEAFFSLLNTT